MAKLKIGNEWWTAHAESENGKLIMVTGRRGMESAIATGKYNYRVEVTWKYEGDEKGLPNFEDSKTMEGVTDKLQQTFDNDPMAIMTGIYTGDNVRNWVFYTLNLKIFERKFNEALTEFDLLPITLYVENDPQWDEYNEMKEQTDIAEVDCCVCQIHLDALLSITCNT